MPARRASAQTIGAQAFSTGFINIDSTSDLNGAEVNLVRNVYRGQPAASSSSAATVI